MVTRIGHMALRVPDLDAAVDFLRQILGMVETERRPASATSPATSATTS